MSARRNSSIFSVILFAGFVSVAAAAEPTTASETSLPLIILFSLLGGLILNLMPCVLPVIGLKVLSFVEQGNQSRRRAFLLNLWYSLGLLTVFFLLATASVTLNMAWGTQFQSTTFTMTMIVLVFAMGLSFLGVWEIPIPGFVGSGKAGDLAAQEGFSGAFFKGAFTTVLATPCSGPFLGPVFGFTISQPWWVTYVIFGAIGVGMASPYLLIGFFPQLMAFLPKPGAWMDTFKQLVGFFLLGTAVYLFSILQERYTIPAMTLLVAVGFVCWQIGRMPFTASSGRKVATWVGGVLITIVVGAFAFNHLQPFETEFVRVGGEWVKVKKTKHLTWQMFTSDTLARAKTQDKVVMVEFTASWCPNCHDNMRDAIDRPEIADIVNDCDVIPIYGDWSTEDDDIGELVESFTSDSIPLLVIYPAGRSEAPIVLRDKITERQLMDALAEACDRGTGNDNG